MELPKNDYGEVDTTDYRNTSKNDDDDDDNQKNDDDNDGHWLVLVKSVKKSLVSDGDGQKNFVFVEIMEDEK